MARKKTEAATATVAAPAASKTDAELRKMFGEDCLYTGTRILDNPPAVISLGPQLDRALGGGLQVGTIATLSGPSGCGKTTTALCAAAQWQARGWPVYYLAVEERIWAMNLTGVAGFDPSIMKILGSRKGGILDAQDYLTGAERILRNEANVLLIVDSFSALSDPHEMSAAKPGEGVPGGSNRMVGSFCRRMAPILPVNENVVIGIGQVYTNIGGKTKWKVNLPTKLEFARGTGLVCQWAEPIVVGGSEKPIGQVVHWKVERSPLGPPGAKVASTIRFGIGIDRVAETVDLAVEFGLIHKPEKSAWYELAYMGEDAAKLNGAEKTRAFFEGNPAEFAVLEEKVRYFLDA